MRFVKNFREKNRMDWEGSALCVLGFVILSLYVIIFTNSPINGEDFALTKDFGNAGFLERFHWIVQRSTEQASGWNARLGEEIKIPASKKVAFRAAKSLKEAVGIKKKVVAVKKAPVRKK